MKKTHVVIGASAAGIGVVNRLARLKPEDQIICISSESDLPYNTCLLADYCIGQKSESELHIFNPDRVKGLVTMILGVRVESIEVGSKQLHLSDGKSIAYDTLFIGTGSSAIIPKIPGISDCAGVFTFHQMADCQKMMSYVKQQSVKKAVVIGAGLTGLEAADLLLTHNISVCVVENQDRVLKSLISPEGSIYVEQAMRNVGVDFYGNDAVVEVCERDNHVVGVKLASGTFIPADMVIVAVGARRNDQLPCQAGIEVSSFGIVTDEYLKTSVEGVWAGGDVAQVTCAFTGNLVASCTWPDAMLQGLTAAYGMAGELKSYQGATRITDSAFFGLQFQAGGVPFGSLARQDEISIKKADQGLSGLYSNNKKVIGYFECSFGTLSSDLKKNLRESIVLSKGLNQ